MDEVQLSTGDDFDATTFYDTIESLDDPPTEQSVVAFSEGSISTAEKPATEPEENLSQNTLNILSQAYLNPS